MKKSLQIAVVYDWLTVQYGGAERVLKALQHVYPEATFFCSIKNSHAPKWTQAAAVKSTFLQNLPKPLLHHRLLSPLMPLAFENLDLSDYQVVISVCSAFSKAVITTPQQLHVCYLLTPPRFLFSHTNYYQLPPLLGSYLRRVDAVAMHRPDVIIPISELIAQRVREIYNLDTADPLYPPVKVLKPGSSRITLNLPFDDYYCVVSRLVKYKQIDIAIQACQELGRNLVIVGEGPEKKSLHRLASQSTNSKIIFLHHLKGVELYQVYRQSKGLIQPNIEDFGLAIAEAQAVGTPTISHVKSGASELLQPKKHGMVMSEVSVRALVDALKRLESTQFAPQILIKNMKKYDTNNFSAEITSRIDQYWSNMTKFG